MPFASGLSTASTTDAALLDVCSSVRKQLADTPDLAVLILFKISITSNTPRRFQPHSCKSALSPRLTLLGCVGESIVGNDQRD